MRVIALCINRRGMKKIDHSWWNVMNHFEASVGETKTPVEGFAVSSLDGIWSDRSFLPWTWILCFSMYALISWPFSVSCFSNVSINFASWKKSAQVKMVIYHLFVMIRFYVHTLDWLNFRKSAQITPISSQDSDFMLTWRKGPKKFGAPP